MPKDNKDLDEFKKRTQRYLKNMTKDEVKSERDILVKTHMTANNCLNSLLKIISNGIINQNSYMLLREINRTIRNIEDKLEKMKTEEI